MQTIEIQKGVRVGFDEMVSGAAKMETAALERFRQQVSLLLARRKTTTILPSREAELLSKINEPAPPEPQKRYAALSAKMKKTPLGEAEHKELSRLIDEMELRAAARLECLIELANLRGISLDALMAQLGIKSLA